MLESSLQWAVHLPKGRVLERLEAHDLDKVLDVGTKLSSIHVNDQDYLLDRSIVPAMPKYSGTQYVGQHAQHSK